MRRASATTAAARAATPAARPPRRCCCWPCSARVVGDATRGFAGERAIAQSSQGTCPEDCQWPDRNGSNVGSYYCWQLNLQFNTPVFDYYVSEVRQGWEDILPGHVVHTIAREDVPLLVIKKVDPMAVLTHAWLQPEAGAPWQPHAAAWGRVPTESLSTSPTARLAIALDSPRAQRGRVYLRIQGRVRVRWQGQPLLDWPREPFVYRASTTFPSLIPIDLDLPAGRSWLEIDLERVNVAKGVGLYFPAALELDTPSDAPPAIR